MNPVIWILCLSVIMVNLNYSSDGTGHGTQKCPNLFLCHLIFCDLYENMHGEQSKAKRCFTAY